jgi:hypothetical protein
MMEAPEDTSIFEKIVAAVSTEEIEFMKIFGIDDGDGSIDSKEFIILPVVRIGTAPPALIRQIRARFEILDRQQLGKIEYDDLVFGRKKRKPTLSPMRLKVKTDLPYVDDVSLGGESKLERVNSAYKTRNLKSNTNGRVSPSCSVLTNLEYLESSGNESDSASFRRHMTESMNSITERYHPVVNGTDVLGDDTAIAAGHFVGCGGARGRSESEEEEAFGIMNTGENKLISHQKQTCDTHAAPILRIERSSASRECKEDECEYIRQDIEMGNLQGPQGQVEIPMSEAWSERSEADRSHRTAGFNNSDSDDSGDDESITSKEEVGSKNSWRLRLKSAGNILLGSSSVRMPSAAYGDDLVPGSMSARMALSRDNSGRRKLNSTHSFDEIAKSIKNQDVLEKLQRAREQQVMAARQLQGSSEEDVSAQSVHFLTRSKEALLLLMKNAYFFCFAAW